MHRRSVSHGPLLRSARSHALLAALLALAPPAAASDLRWMPGVRIGAALEGQQHTLQNGLELGFRLDRTAGGAVDFGFGLGFANDWGGDDRPSTTIFSLEAHARTSTERWHPFAEAGVGYYWLNQGVPGDGLSDPAVHGAAGGFLGAGYEWRTTGPSNLGIALGVAYHVIAAEVSATSGNLEDYGTLGLTFRW